MTNTAAQASINNPALASFEARAQEQGTLDEAGFFAQSDWEFGLENLQDQSRDALSKHLNKAEGVDHATAVFLKGFLMNGRDVTFTPFED
jgi:hypothetical protein